MPDLTARITEILHRELDEHGYEDDDEKRGQVAHHFAALIAQAAEEHYRPQVDRLRGAFAALALDLLQHTATTPDDDDHEIICEVESTIAGAISSVLQEVQ